MIITFPDHIKDNSRLELMQVARALECDKRTVMSRAEVLGIMRHQRKAGRPYFTGREVWRIWAL